MGAIISTSISQIVAEVYQLSEQKIIGNTQCCLLDPQAASRDLPYPTLLAPCIKFDKAGLIPAVLMHRCDFKTHNKFNI